MPSRRRIIDIGLSIAVALFIASVVWPRDSRFRTAQEALPNAQALLSESDSFKEVRAFVNSARGGSLCFVGGVPTRADLDRLKSEVGRRFTSEQYDFWFAVSSWDEDQVAKPAR